MAFISTWCLLLWGRSVLAFKFVEITFGLVSASDVAYYSYLFAMVTKNHYSAITSLTRAAVLLGMCASYLAGQVLVSSSLLDYFQLNIVSLVSVSLAFLIALFLPRPVHSDIFHAQLSNSDIEIEAITAAEDVAIAESKPQNQMGEFENNKTDSAAQNTENSANDKAQNDNQITIQRRSFKSGILFLMEELRSVYKSASVVTWSIWWALASCGNLQIQNYIQNLWLEVAENNDNSYNGAVEAISTLVSE